MGLRTYRAIVTTAIGDLNYKSFSDAGITTDASDHTRPVYALSVLPASPAVPTDGREPLTYSAEALIARFNAKGRKLPVDLNHDTELGGGATGGRAVGWIVGLFSGTDGGLYAWVDPTDEGVSLLEGRAYGYTSPTVRVGAGTSTITELKSLALTNNPALEMPCTFSAQDEDEDEAETATETVEADKTAVEPAEALQATDTPSTPAEAAVEAPDTVSEPAQTTATIDAAPAVEVIASPALDEAAIAAIVAAVLEKTTAPREAAFTAQSAADDETLTFAASARTVHDQVVAAGYSFSTTDIVAAFQVAAQVETFRAQVEALTTRAQTAETTLSTFQAEVQEARIQRALDDACRTGKISPAGRPGMETFARSDFEAFSKHVKRLTPHSATFSLATRGIDEDETYGLTPEQLERCKRTGTKPETLAAELKKLNN